MKKDRMLEKIIEMTVKLTKYELREHIEKVQAEIDEANKWLVDYRIRDERQLAKMVEQAEERVEFKKQIAALEEENKALRAQIDEETLNSAGRRLAT